MKTNYQSKSPKGKSSKRSGRRKGRKTNQSTRHPVQGDLALVELEAEQKWYEAQAEQSARQDGEPLA